MNKNDLSNALTEIELSHKRGSAVFEEITRHLFEDTTPNPEYSCQYEHYVALADTVNKCLYQTGKLIGKLRELSLIHIYRPVQTLGAHPSRRN